MTNIDQQNKLWDDLDEQNKSVYSNRYKQAKATLEKNPDDNVMEAVVACIEPLFGKHNLESYNSIKTWKDILVCDCDVYSKEDDINYLCLDGLDIYGQDSKLVKKLQATIKIVKLIELGYGGMITDEEWNDRTFPKYVVHCYNTSGSWLLDCYMLYDYRHLIAFHTSEQREEFLSYPENVKLIEEYFMLCQKKNI